MTRLPHKPADLAAHVQVYGGLYQRLAAAVKTALKKARGRVRSFEQQLASAGDADAVQRQGDIIVANLYR